MHTVELCTRRVNYGTYPVHKTSARITASPHLLGATQAVRATSVRYYEVYAHFLKVYVCTLLFSSNLSMHKHTTTPAGEAKPPNIRTA